MYILVDMSIYLNVEEAKEMIIEELEKLDKQNKTPRIKFKNLYKNKKQWSKTFFKAGKELDRTNDNIEMSIKYGFHQVELSH